MRLTVCCRKISRIYEANYIWKHAGYVRPIPAPQMWYLKDKVIVDPMQEIDHTTGLYTDSHDDLPQPAPETQEVAGQEVYEFHNTKLVESLRQACVLTKTVIREELPAAVTDNIGRVSIANQDEQVQRAIMQANVWDPTKDRLPKRINRQIQGWKFKREYGIPQSRIRNVLLENLVRLSQTLDGRYPDLLLTRDIIQNGHVAAAYGINDRTMYIRGMQEFVMNSLRPLQPFADTESIDSTTLEDLPDLDPVSPFIDLVQSHVAEKSLHDTGYHGDYRYVEPHTIYLTTHLTQTDMDQRTTLLMYCMAHAVARAQHKYGASVRELPAPITLQAVLTDSQRFHMAAFQLNTLQLDHSTGIKNIAWFHPTAHLYNKILPKRAMLRNTLYQDYDPMVMQRLLAMYVNGAGLEDS